MRACLAAYKERFVRSLSEVQRGHVDFSRAVFLAAAFYLVARKHKVAVDRVKLLGPLGVTATEFMQVCPFSGEGESGLVLLSGRRAAVSGAGCNVLPPTRHTGAPCTPCGHLSWRKKPRPDP